MFLCDVEEFKQVALPWKESEKVKYQQLPQKKLEWKLKSKIVPRFFLDGIKLLLGLVILSVESCCSFSWINEIKKQKKDT